MRCGMIEEMVMEHMASEEGGRERLEQEIKLHVNERLYKMGMISKEVYEAAKIEIVNKKT